MSKATKRKHVTNEVINDFILPEPRQQIVKVVGSRGNNLHEVVTAQGETFLVSMPTKFRKNVWIKRGDYVIVDPIEEGDKVKAEIAHILYKEQIKYIKSESLWPTEFMDEDKGNGKEAMIPDDMLPPSGDDDDDESDDDDDDDTAIPVNPNHRVRIATTYESSDEDDDNDDG